MGNQLSVPRRAEDQENGPETDARKVTAPTTGCDCAHHGTPVMVSTHTVQLYDEVDLGLSLPEDTVATSSPETVQKSAGANGKNLGKEAKAEAPAAKSRFFLTLSRPVPGDHATDSASAPGRLDVSPREGMGNKGPSDSTALPLAAAQGHGPDKTPGQTPAGRQGSSATRGPAALPLESEGAAPSRPKDAGFFEKFFKLDKGQEKVPADSRQEAESVAQRDQADAVPGLPGQPQDAPAERDLVQGKGKGQEVTPASCSIPRDPEDPETAKGESQTTDTTENNSSMMSFFKTLVSPNKAEARKDLEDTGAGKSPAASADLVKSDNAKFVPQGTPGAAKNPPPTETAKDGSKHSGGPSSLPLSKLFWKKSVKEDSVPTAAEENVVCESPVQVIKSEDTHSALQTVDLDEEGDATPAPSEVKLKREERKPPKTSLLAFLRQMSVKGDGGITHSEEINGKDSSYQTAQSSEKAAAPPEPEPEPEPAGAGAGAGQKGREGSSKDKKVAADTSKQRNNKQEAKEPAPCACAQPAAREANALPSGHKPQKRPEKRRQSLGGFFKGLGPKRMLDAQVQTDPVSIGPVGKSK